MVRFFLLAAVAFAQTGVHNYSSDHFSIAIPEGWTAIPQGELDNLSKALRERAPSVDAQEYNYGFRPPASPHTRVLIQVKHDRWSEDVFDQTSRLPRARGLIQHGVTSGSPELAKLDAKIGDMRWDADRQILWMRTEIANAAEGKTEVLSGVHLNNEGSIQVHCSAAAADYAMLEPTFLSLIQSVKIEEAWKYRPRNPIWLMLTENRWVTLSIVAAITIMLIGAFGGKKKPKPAQS